jgi:tight adherence protein C
MGQDDDRHRSVLLSRGALCHPQISGNQNMTPEWLLVSFFLFTLTAVSGAGYIFVLKPGRTGEEPASSISRLLTQPDLPAPQAAVLDIFRVVGSMVPDRSSQRESARRLLLLAGYRWPSAVSTFLGIKCMTAFTLGVAGAWASITFQESGSPSIAALCGLGFGFLLPDQILKHVANTRAARLRRGLPAALDLLVLAIEAGQSIDAAIVETSRASEFAQLHLELRADPSREDALRNLISRTQDQEIRKFAALLIDTDRFGSSLGPALRSHGRYLRTRFRQNAQERARKVAVKLIFPVFFLIFPSVILVTLGPAVILIFQQMTSLVGQ